MYTEEEEDLDSLALSRQFFESAAFSEFQAGVVLEPESPRQDEVRLLFVSISLLFIIYIIY